MDKKNAEILGPTPIPIPVDGVTRLFTYDGWNPIIEFDQAGNWKAMNLYGFGADEILGRYDATLGHLIYKQDKQGNVMFVLNASNQTVEKYTYDAYGTPTILSTNNTQLSTSAYGNRFMYTGREWLGELGIYDYRNRMYLPALGRFLQTDPTGFDGGDMNLFRYCDDDPVDGSDPTGLVNTNAGTTLEQRMRLFYGSGDTGGGLYDLNVANSLALNGAPVTVVGQHSRTGPHHPPGRGARGPSESDAPLRMLFEEDAVVEGYDRYPNYQLANKDNEPRSGGSLKFQEIAIRDPKSSYPLEHTTNAPAKELQRGGLFPDHVGFKDPEHRARGTDPAGKNITNVKFRSEYPNGNPGPKISTEMQHVSSHNPGKKPTVYIRVTHP